jgi:archaellum component FlaG (FlaF/FlaG flagellin family)
MSKGLTPVIATVLLMTISVAATGSAYIFLTDLQSEAQESARDRLSEQEREAQSSINMRTVYRGADGYTVFNLQNTGSVSIAIEEDGSRLLDVYVDGQQVDWDYVGSGSSTVRLNPSQSKVINSTETFPGNGDAQQLLATGPDGTEDAHTCYNSGTNIC